MLKAIVRTTVRKSCTALYKKEKMIIKITDFIGIKIRHCDDNDNNNDKKKKTEENFSCFSLILCQCI